MVRHANDLPIAARNGHTVMVGVVARISGCENQKEVSLDDQVDHAKSILADIYDGPVEFVVFATKAKGERLDRPELADIEAALRDRSLDLLIMEDLGRLVRGGVACWLLGIAVDHGTRCISPNDGVDTMEPTWEEDALSACRDHVGHNAHASKRIKQKTMNRFEKNGETAKRPIFGYIVPADATRYDDWQRDDAATPIIREGYNRLLECLNGSAVSDWFNDNGVPRGPAAKRSGWTGTAVLQFYRNPLVSGRPGRGFKHTVKHHESGRRVSVPNPAGPVLLNCPHLAHITPEEQDDLTVALREKNAKFKRPTLNGVDPRSRVSRKRTLFPGQHALCWYCGQQAVWGANGMSGSLMCSGSREWHCWNSVGFSGQVAATRVTDLILQELHKLDDFNEQYWQLVEEASSTLSGGMPARLLALQAEEVRIARESEKIKLAILEYGASPLVQELLDAHKLAEQKVLRDRRELERLSRQRPQVPTSLPALRVLFEEQFSKLAANSYEFGNLLRVVVPRMHFYLVRLCDGGHLLPRARIQLDLAGHIRDAALVPGLRELLTRVVTVDLFDRPPQRERIRLEAVRLNDGTRTYRQIAAALSEQATGTAVGRALQLQQRMDQLGLGSPYQFVSEPPDDYPKLRRHKNRKYRFEPLPGYERPVI